jgi:FMN phosphatase YigB (HAD superfamily)
MQSKEKIILTDADGVLINWNDGFDTYMTAKGFPRVPDTDTEYSIAKRHNVSMHQATESVTEFNKSSHIVFLKPFADSVENVIKLANLGFRFIVVTSISDHPDAHEYRTENLKNIFGDVFDEINCIEQGASKASILTRWAGTGYFWIEDHMRQAEAGHEVGLNTVLINHPYNTHYETDLFPRVSFETPWAEIYKMVKKEYQL